jgi:hypothetical protein
MRIIWLYKALIGVIALCVIFLLGCSQAQKDQESGLGHALIKPHLPAELSPQHYPPAGFVFSGFRYEGLPEARYGVASPPVKPRAHFLILAEPGLPSESYFSLMPYYLRSGMSVWIYEPAGQGGAGKFQSQGNKISYGHAVNPNHALKAFIDEVIKPDQETPLYIFGMEGSGLWAISLIRSEITPLIKGVVVLDPYVSITENRPVFQRDMVLTKPRDQIAHVWQIYNPDLRLSQKSSQIIIEEEQRVKRLIAPKVPNISLPSQKKVQLIWITSEMKTLKAQSDLCQSLGSCDFHSDLVGEAAYEKSVERIAYHRDALHK